jgi:hypothetical protein
MTTLYQHVSRPEWGKAQLIEEAGDKRTFLFWDVTKRTFCTSHWTMMEPVETGSSESDIAIRVAHQTVSEGTDFRALRLQTRLLGDAVTSDMYAKAITEEPREGMYANTGHNIMRDVLEGWLVGEWEHVAIGLSRAISFLEHARLVGERWGGDGYLFYAALHAEKLALAYWLRGDAVRANESFLASAIVATKHFESEPKERRTALGSLMLRWMAAGDPQRGLDIANNTDIAKPRAHPEDLKTGRQNRYYDANGRTLKTLAEDMVQGKPKRQIYDRAMKYVKKEIQVNLTRNDYSMVDFPEHAVWMKVFAGDVLGISDPKIAIASLYLLMPTVKQPPAIAQCLATQSFLR